MVFNLNVFGFNVLRLVCQSGSKVEVELRGSEVPVRKAHTGHMLSTGTHAAKTASAAAPHHNPAPSTSFPCEDKDIYFEQLGLAECMTG